MAFDFRPQFHWRGNFFVRAYQIHGKGLTAANIDNLNTISGSEATATTRLFELWYEQHIGDWLRIRIGQQSAGQEFLVTTAAKPFVNSAFAGRLCRTRIYRPEARAIRWRANVDT